MFKNIRFFAITVSSVLLFSTLSPAHIGRAKKAPPTLQDMQKAQELLDLLDKLEAKLADEANAREHENSKATWIWTALAAAALAAGAWYYFKPQHGPADPYRAAGPLPDVGGRRLDDAPPHDAHPSMGPAAGGAVSAMALARMRQQDQLLQANQKIQAAEKTRAIQRSKQELEACARLLDLGERAKQERAYGLSDLKKRAEDVRAFYAAAATALKAGSVSLSELKVIMKRVLLLTDHDEMAAIIESLDEQNEDPAYIATVTLLTLAKLESAKRSEIAAMYAAKGITPPQSPAPAPEPSAPPAYDPRLDPCAAAAAAAADDA